MQAHQKKDNKNICFDFQKTGRCKFGKRCKFDHVPPETVIPPSNTAVIIDDNDPTRKSGRILRYDTEKQYGFIATDGGGGDRFFHKSEVIGSSFALNNFVRGQLVKFEDGTGKNGKPCAIKITVVQNSDGSGATQPPISREIMMLAYEIEELCELVMCDGLGAFAEKMKEGRKHRQKISEAIRFEAQFAQSDPDVYKGLQKQLLRLFQSRAFRFRTFECDDSITEGTQQTLSDLLDHLITESYLFQSAPPLCQSEGWMTTTTDVSVEEVAVEDDDDGDLRSQDLDLCRAFSALSDQTGPNTTKMIDVKHVVVESVKAGYFLEILVSAQQYWGSQWLCQRLPTALSRYLTDTLICPHPTPRHLAPSILKHMSNDEKRFGSLQELMFDLADFHVRRRREEPKKRQRGSSEVIGIGNYAAAAPAAAEPAAAAPVGWNTNYRIVPVDVSTSDFSPDAVPELRAISPRPIDFDHHIDTLFHLNREDAVLPLREAINCMRDPNITDAQRREKHIRTYVGTQFEGLQTHGLLGVVYLVRFKPMPRVRWNATKRLMPGALVVISHDRFQTAIVAVVATQNSHDRAEQLKQGRLMLKVLDEDRVLRYEEVFGSAEGRQYTMVESQVYWEASVHVLKSLQTMGAPRRDVLRVIEARQGDDVEAEGNNQRLILDWSRQISEIYKEAMTLDDTQAKAMRHIFGNSISIVQGPPGTGKSYVGVMAAMTLLDRWYQDGNRPRQAVEADTDDHDGDSDVDGYEYKKPQILIVTYTNHALDDFLSSILERCPELCEAELPPLPPPGRENETDDELRKRRQQHEKQYSRSRKNQLLRLGGKTRLDKLQRYTLQSAVSGRAGMGALREDEEDFNKTLANFLDENRCVIDSDVTPFFQQFAELKESAMVKFRMASSEFSNARSNLRHSIANCNSDDMYLQCSDLLPSADTLQQKAESVRQARDFIWGALHKNLGTLKLNDYVVEAAVERLAQTAVDVNTAARLTQTWLSTWRDDAAKVQINKKKNGAKSEVAPGLQILRMPPMSRAQATSVNNDNDDDDDDEFNDEGYDQQTDADVGAAANARAFRVNLGDFYEAQQGDVDADGPGGLPKHPAVPTEWANVSINRWPADLRGPVFRYIRCRHFHRMAPELRAAREHYNRTVNTTTAKQRDLELDTLRRARVIGATTTGMAKYMSMMKKLPIQMVIVEEAAEIGEAQLLAALPPECRQVCLIGDHQQLRPHVNVYDFCRKYHLDTSMMERLITTNMVEYVTLNTQRRMRPEIADFMRPLYRERFDNNPRGLLDHSSVKGRPTDVVGFDGNIQFIEHDLHESKDDTSSTKNEQEALFAVFLAMHVMQQQKYTPVNKEIVIIAPYVAQVLTVRRLLREKCGASADLPRVTSVDDYQGEECDIAILSLTRSQKPGFVGIENRITVMLSRARFGMFVLGNFNCFRRARETIWTEVLNFAKKSGYLLQGEARLKCTMHGNRFSVPVSLVNDPKKLFGFSPLGGCQLKQCDARRDDCGHSCQSLLCHGGPCQRFRCDLECARPAVKCRVSDDPSKKHLCTKKCFETPCARCDVPVKKVFNCVHKHTVNNVECHVDESQGSTCPALITVQHPVCKKHQVQVRCGEYYHEWIDDATKADDDDPKSRFNFDKIKPCTKECCLTLPVCNHKCRRECHECTRIVHHDHDIDDPGSKMLVVHGPCRHACGRPLICQHTCTEPCSDICPPCPQSRCETACEHSKCRLPCAEPCTECTMPCKNKCPHQKCTKKCGEPCDKPRCSERCTKKPHTACEHQCSGVCGEPCPSICLECKMAAEGPGVCAEELFLDFDSDKSGFDALIMELPCNCIVDVASMDGWIDSRVDSHEVLPLTCPCAVGKQRKQCGKSVRGVMRYKKEFNIVHRKVQSCKKKLLDTAKDLENKMHKCKDVLIEMFQRPSRYEPFNVLVNRAKKQIDVLENAKTRNMRFNQFLCGYVHAMRMLYNTIFSHLETAVSPIERDLCNSITTDTAVRLLLDGNKCTNNFGSANDLESARRSACYLQMAVLRIAVRLGFDDGDGPVDGTIVTATRAAEAAGTDSSAREKHLLGAFVYLWSRSRQPPTKKEMSAIHEALVSAGDIRKSGAWYMCPNGHLYTIGDCGGAVVQSTCPECNAVIGGTNHRVDSSNTHTGSVDGSTAAAWPGN